MKYSYKTKGTCSGLIQLDIEGDTVHNIKFLGGCEGNLKTISILLEGSKVNEVEQKCKGITCGGRSTSCADQLAHAVREAYNASLS